jgi:hypothetical protein
MWPLLPLVLLPLAVRAAGRALAAPRLGLGLHGAHLGDGPGALRRRAALALSGAVAVYLAGALLATGTWLVRGEEHETNLVEAVRGWETTAAWALCDRGDGADDLRGLAPGDEIVAIDDRPTPDGEALRRALGWTPVRDGERVLSVRRDGRWQRFCVYPKPSRLPLPAGWVPAPEPGVSLRIDRPRMGLGRALGRGLAFPAAPGSAIRWLAAAVASRAALRVRDEEITYLPAWSPVSWPLRVADLLGFFALVALLPWPGLDGGELLLVAYQAALGEPPPWLSSLFRSRIWGVVMAVASGIVIFVVWAWVDAVLGFDPHRPDVRAWFMGLFRWPG